MQRAVSVLALCSCIAACSASDDPGYVAGTGGMAGSAAGGGVGGSAAGAGTGGVAGAGATAGTAGSGALGGSSGVGGAAGAGGNCPLGSSCNPIPIGALPYSDQRDTSLAPGREIDSYACSPSTNESGPELFYRLQVDVQGLLSVAVSDDVGVDADIHLLQGTTGDTCLERADTSFSIVVDPGQYHLVVDTWVDGTGSELSGPFELRVDLTPLESGTCAMDPVDLRMFWAACDPNIDCYMGQHTDGQTYAFLRTPATGPVVKEAHLVTVAESFPGGWPTSFTDGIPNHYAVSEAATGYVMSRREPWAPAGEGGSEYGQGSTGAPLPVVDEAWYVNMYWRDRPTRGTRMIVRNPVDGRSVVASAGYETGPGANTAIGGASEEIHHYLGTSHLGELLMGFALDQSLPLGPIDCQ